MFMQPARPVHGAAFRVERNVTTVVWCAPSLHEFVSLTIRSGLVNGVNLFDGLLRRKLPWWRVFGVVACLFTVYNSLPYLGGRHSYTWQPFNHSAGSMLLAVHSGRMWYVLSYSSVRDCAAVVSCQVAVLWLRQQCSSLPSCGTMVAS
jgi:hypothetical protein